MNIKLSSIAPSILAAVSAPVFSVSVSAADIVASASAPVFLVEAHIVIDRALVDSVEIGDGLVLEIEKAVADTATATDAVDSLSVGLGKTDTATASEDIAKLVSSVVVETVTTSDDPVVQLSGPTGVVNGTYVNRVVVNEGE